MDLALDVRSNASHHSTRTLKDLPDAHLEELDIENAQLNIELEHLANEEYGAIVNQE